MIPNEITEAEALLAMLHKFLKGGTFQASDPVSVGCFIGTKDGALGTSRIWQKRAGAPLPSA